MFQILNGLDLPGRSVCTLIIHSFSVVVIVNTNTRFMQLLFMFITIYNLTLLTVVHYKYEQSP